MRRVVALLALGCAGLAVAAPPSAADFFARAERGHFRVAADGRRLAWLAPVAEADGRRRAQVFVQVLDADGRPQGSPRQLTHAARDVPDIAWKGDATLLLRQDDAGDEDWRVLALDAASGRVRDLTPPGRGPAALLDPLPGDAAHVLVTRGDDDPAHPDVWRVDLGGGAPVRVERNPGDVTAWRTDHHGRVRLALRGEGLALAWLHRAGEADGWTPLARTDFRVDVAPLFFDADDRRVYALSNRGRDRRALVLIDPGAGGAETPVFEAPGVDVGEVAWSQARQRLARADFDDERPAHRFFDPEAERAWHRLEARLPGAALSVQSTDAAERWWVVAADDDRSAGTRWLYDARADVLRPLGAVNPRVPVAATSPMTPVRYAARDGLAIPAYLTLPAGRPAKDLACVVKPHGGPWTRDAWGWDAEVQFLASRGLCVLQMNYRGSTGYGRAFWEAGFRQWGRAMQDDVDDGAAWLVARGIADPERLGIVGASYGGYVALAGVAFAPGRYAAAVDLAGMPDLVALLDALPAAARAQRPQLLEMIGDPARAEDRARLDAASPARHPGRIVAPLLVGQGGRDPRVPRQDVDRFVAALRRQGVDVDYVVREDEGHGFRAEEARIAWEQAVAAFLERHLKP